MATTFNWPEIIKRHRGRHGLSVRGLAEKLGVNPKTVFYLETGKSAPSYLTEYKLKELMAGELAELSDGR